MNAKKELLATSLLAIALAVGLGTLSFGLFSEAPPNVQIGVFAKKNGATSLSFLPQDQVLLEAQVSSNNASVAGALVTFEVESPNGTDFLVLTANTDSLGTASVTFQIPWPSFLSSESTWELGTWQTKATIKIYEQTLYATTNFNCETLTPTIDVYTEKGGHGQNAPGGTFTTNETVEVYIEVWNELNHTVPYQLVSFEVLVVGTGHYTTVVNATNASGIATITNPIIPNATAKYEDIATTNYEGTTLTDVITFTVQLSS
ncbi:MAG: hypothetical protein ABR962_03670 [Candidatus Bathyarchaeia archaeon]